MRRNPRRLSILRNATTALSMKHYTLSRVAERIYWLGRYLERAETTAHLITVNSSLLMDLPIRLPRGWQSLVAITGQAEQFSELYDAASERNTVRFITADRRNPNAIINSLSQARENARTVREMMPRLAYEYINDLYLYADSELTGTLSRIRRAEVLDGVARRIQALDGFLSANMLHDEPWEFLRLGHFVERADMTTRVVDVRTTELDTEDETANVREFRWRSVLLSLYAMQSYRRAKQTIIDRDSVLEFLFMDTTLPRSYARSLEAIRRSLRSLPRHDKPLRICNSMRRELKQTDMAEMPNTTLHEFIDSRQLQLASLHTEIGSTYFYYKPRRRRKRAAS